MGERGGREAANRLWRGLIDNLPAMVRDEEVEPDLKSNMKLVASLYANVKALPRQLAAAGIPESQDNISDFLAGFANEQSLFNVVDVKDGKSEKMTGK